MKRNEEYLNTQSMNETTNVLNNLNTDVAMKNSIDVRDILFFFFALIWKLYQTRVEVAKIFSAE